MQHEVEPSIVSALAISDVIMTVDEKLVFLKNHYPSLGGVIENFYGNRVKNQIVILTKSCLNILEKNHIIEYLIWQLPNVVCHMNK